MADDTETEHKDTHTHTPPPCILMAPLRSSLSSTGVIYTAGILDCESKDAYWLTVYATDRGVTPLSASVEVFIQVPTLQQTNTLGKAKRAMSLSA